MHFANIFLFVYEYKFLEQLAGMIVNPPTPKPGRRATATAAPPGTFSLTAYSMFDMPPALLAPGALLADLVRYRSTGTGLCMLWPLVALVVDAFAFTKRYVDNLASLMNAA